MSPALALSLSFNIDGNCRLNGNVIDLDQVYSWGISSISISYHWAKNQSILENIYSIASSLSSISRIPCDFCYLPRFSYHFIVKLQFISSMKLPLVVSIPVSINS